MKKTLLKSLIGGVALTLFASNQLSAQCSGGTLIATLTPTGAYQLRNSTLAGEYFNFTAAAGVNYEWTYCNGGGSGSLDMQITILNNVGAYAGGYNDDFCGLSSHLVWQAPASGTYRVLISRYNCQNTGVNVGNMAYRAVAPANDLCASATAITMPSTTIGNTTFATVDTHPYGGSSNGVWYSITGNGNQFTFTTCGGVTNYDTYLAAYTGGCAGLTGVAVNDDACGLQSSITFCTTPGTPYLILVYGFSTGNGSFTLNASQVTIPVPTITPSTASICVGGSTTMTASGSTSYTWNPGALTGATQTLSPSSTTTYTISGTTSGCVRTNTATITVNPLPTVTANTSASAVCTGNSVTFTGGGATSYTWTGGVSDGVPFTPSATDTYTVTGTDGNGCSNTASTTVTVNALPTVTASAASGTICDGNSETLTASGATNYAWSSGGSAATEVVSPSTTTTYTVTGTDGNGCSNTATVTVNVNALPTVAAAANWGTICDGGADTLNATGGVSYLWSSGGTASMEIVMPNTTSTYTVTGTDANGCSNTATVTVNVNALPTVMAMAAMDTICEGMSDTLMASGASTYMWSSGGMDTTEVVMPSATSTYTVTGTDINGCMNTAMVTVAVNMNPVIMLADSTQCGGTVTLDAMNAGAMYMWNDSSTAQTLTVSMTGMYYVDVTDSNGCWASDSAMVTINTVPTVNLGADSTQCGGTVTLDAMNAGSMYMWNDSTTAQTLTVSMTGNYYVDVTDSNGCWASDSVMVTINTPPTVTGSASASTVCLDDADVTLTGSPAGGTWSGPGVTGSNFDPSTGNGAQVLTYSYTDSNGCSGTATTTVQVNPCTGINETAFENGVNVYPNPNNGSFTLAIANNVGDMNIEITDATGRVVYSSVENNVQAGFNKQINMEGMANGIYMMRLTTGGEQQIIKISVQN